MAASSKPPQGKTFSSRLKGMKFMQRAEEKKTLAAATKRKREDSDEVRHSLAIFAPTTIRRTPGAVQGLPALSPTTAQFCFLEARAGRRGVRRGSTR
jgi:hypothetical protein